MGMEIEQLFGVLAGFACLGLGIYLPVRFFMLIGEVKSLEQRLAVLDKKLPVTPANPVAVPVAVPSVSAVVAPPPLPPKATQPVVPAPAAVVQPNPLSERLRDLGLLPPTDLNGEYALGAWWAVRVGGLLAVAAVVFLGIWLNLNSGIPPIVRVLEVALVGAGLFWGGLRLASKRQDLGEVLAASGLAVWQFAAWATYGLDKMRVCESPAQAALVQFLVAFGVAFVAMARGSKLFGQLAVIFATVAVYFSIGSGAAPGSTATGAGLIALLGVILMVRGPWGAAGVLGLIGSQACLLFLYDAMPTNGANYLPLQLAAVGSFLALWLGERLVKDDAVLLGRDSRSAFQLASFFAPACLSLFLATGGENDRATVSLLIAAVASIAGYLELRRNALVSEVLLLAAVGFVGAGLAWLVDPHLVWLIWAIAAAATLVVGTRTRSELVRWSSEILAGVAIFAFIDHPPAKPWIALAGLAALGLMLALREDWERVSGWQKIRRVVGILGLAVSVLAVQDHLSKADTGWPWLVLLFVAAVRFRPALLWAAAPAYVLSACLVVFDLTQSKSWSILWSAMILLINAVALWRLIGLEGAGAKVVRSILSFATAVIVFTLVHYVSYFAFSQGLQPARPSASMAAFTWTLGGLLLVALTSALRRLGTVPTDLSLFAAGAFFGHVLRVLLIKLQGVQELGLIQAPFILIGLACLLYVLAIHTRGQGAWGTFQRTAIASAILLGSAFFMLAHLPGAGVSLFWALASVLTFVIGHLLATRSLRMVGLVGLAIATIRVLSHDITDLLGRIAACTALAVAFFGVAWLYGRITADKKDA
ncbi:MAG: hypothetical protein RL079_81 [Verrucomicrobiota bacterium]